MKIYVGSDHAGTEMRSVLVEQLNQHGYEVQAVLGASGPNDRCDYPDVAAQVCQKIIEDGGSKGLLICGSGQGMAMKANKYRGIRAAVCGDVYSASMARAHNDANILCLGQRVVGIGHASMIVDVFFAGKFEGGRHSNRVMKIDAD